MTQTKVTVEDELANPKRAVFCTFCEEHDNPGQFRLFVDAVCVPGPDGTRDDTSRILNTEMTEVLPFQVCDKPPIAGIPFTRKEAQRLFHSMLEAGFKDERKKPKGSTG